MRNDSMYSSRTRLAVAIFLVAPIVTSAQTANVQPRITAAIDNTARMTIAQSTHPLALPAHDTGRLDGGAPMKRMILMLDGSPEQDSELSTFLESQQSNGSPDFHNWLTPDQFGQRFGPAPQDIQAVTAWLQQQGFSVERVAQSGRFIQFSGTAAQVENAFQTQMHTYQLNAEAHVANASNISIPVALSPVVRGVVSLHNFFHKPMISRYYGVHRNSGGKLAPVIPDTTIANNNGTFDFISPDDFAKIYDSAPLLLGSINGANQTIAIVALSDISLTDVSTFQSMFGLPNSPPTVIHDGDDPGDVTGGADVEATLDTEWSNAVAPGAKVDLVVSESTLISDGADLSALFIVDQNLSQIVSESIGSCEAATSSREASFLAALWQQAAAQGMSVFVSSGDTGAAACDPNAPVPAPGAQGGVSISVVASTPYDTAVGGTEFNEAGAGVNPSPGTTAATFWNAANGAGFESAIGYIPEIAWNDSCTGCITGDDSLEATGGGVSILFQTPSYQTLNVSGLQTTLNAFNLRASNQALHPRGVPDVSLAASPNHDGYLMCFSEDPGLNGELACQTNNGQIQNAGIVGGTSVSSPAFAGIMALVDQKVGKPQGLANNVLYSLAAAENCDNCNSNTRIRPATGTSCVFNDVTLGTNGVPGNDITGDPIVNALGFPSGTGYDLTTGLGSVDAFNLATAWNTAAAAFKASQTAISSPASINITHGQPVTVNVTVMKSGGGVGPTGNVSLITDESVAGIPGTSTIEGLVLSNGAASTGAINFLPGGSYRLTASYPGDGTYAGSTSTPPILVNVAKESGFITLFTFQPPLTGGESPSTSISIPYGTQVGIEGLVSGATGGNQLTNSGDGFATGALAFNSTLNGMTTNLGSAITRNSQGEALFVSCPASCFAVGASTVNASYTAASDPSFNSASTPTESAAITVTVTTAPTATSISPSSTVVTSGGMVTLTATVATQSGGLAPTGPATVQFFNNGTLIATVPVVKIPGNPKFPLWLLASAILLYLAYAASRPRTRGAFAYSGLALVALLVTAFAGCGGGGGGGGGGGSGGSGGGGTGSVQIGAVTVVSSSNGTATTPASLIVQTALTTTFKSGTAMVITASYPGDTNYAATGVGNRTPVTITVQ